MLKQTDIEGRLRLLRYGMLVVVVVTFAVALSYPIVMLQDKAMLMDFLPQSILYTVGVAVVCIIVYFVYAYILRRTMGTAAEGNKDKTEEKPSQ